MQSVMGMYNIRMRLPLSGKADAEDRNMRSHRKAVIYRVVPASTSPNTLLQPTFVELDKTRCELRKGS